MRKRLYIDFDDTIVNSTKAFCSVYNSIFNNQAGFKPADYKKVSRWDYSDQCSLLDSSDIESFFCREEFFAQLEFIEKAKETIEELANHYKIIVCSIGSLENIGRKAFWLKENLPFIDGTILIDNGESRADKSIIDMSEGIFIDDHQENLISSNASIKICFGSILEWNNKWEGTRAFTWDQIKGMLLTDSAIA